MSMAGFRSTTCEQCGSHFMDDCGDAFCSSSCERAYEKEHNCENCGEFAEELNEYGLCEDCENEEEEEDE